MEKQQFDIFCNLHLLSKTPVLLSLSPLVLYFLQVLIDDLQQRWLDVRATRSALVGNGGWEPRSQEVRGRSKWRCRSGVNQSWLMVRGW
jgi:hypothetical protein